MEGAMPEALKKTHTLVKTPSLNVRYLADYMAASEQKRRSILKGCKYRSTARMIQHIEAKLHVSEYIRSGGADPAELLEKSKSIRAKLAADQFDEDTNKHNADYLKRYAEVAPGIAMPKCEVLKGGKFIDVPIGGISVRFDPALRLTRTTKTNKLKCGALMLRYQKGKALPDATAGYQSAAILGLLKLIEGDDGQEPEGALCATLDAYSGALHLAPTNAIYLFKEMTAACESIAERWDAISPPKGAIF
jgi:hypothetical protein